MTDPTNAARVISFLNQCIKADPTSMTNLLLDGGCLTNQFLAEMVPTSETADGDAHLSPLSILVAAVRVATGQVIAAETDSDGRLTGFVYYRPSAVEDVKWPGMNVLLVG